MKTRKGRESLWKLTDGASVSVCRIKSGSSATARTGTAFLRGSASLREPSLRLVASMWFVPDGRIGRALAGTGA